MPPSIRYNSSMVCIYYTTKEINSRAFLARILEEFYGVRDAARRLQTGQHGKPYLKDVPVRFNLSHSGALTAVAAGRHEVGLDLQRRDRAPHDALLARLSAAEREEDFFRLWTAKEAYIKYLGSSLAAMLPRLTFEGGTLLEDGAPVPAHLTFDELEGCTLCMCTEKPERIDYRPL